MKKPYKSMSCMGLCAVLLMAVSSVSAQAGKRSAQSPQLQTEAVEPQVYIDSNGNMLSLKGVELIVISVLEEFISTPLNLYNFIIENGGAFPDPNKDDLAGQLNTGPGDRDVIEGKVSTRDHTAVVVIKGTETEHGTLKIKSMKGYLETDKGRMPPWGVDCKKYLGECPEEAWSQTTENGGTWICWTMEDGTVTCLEPENANICSKSPDGKIECFRIESGGLLPINGCFADMPNFDVPGREGDKEVEPEEGAPEEGEEREKEGWEYCAGDADE